MLEVLKDRQRTLDHIRDAVDREAAAAARHARMIGLTHHAAAALARDLLRHRQAVLGQRAAGDEQQRMSAVALQHFRCLVDGIRREAWLLAKRWDLRDAAGLAPGGI